MKKDKGEIVFTKYGPYTVVDTKIIGGDNNELKGPRVVSLCRCGESKNKPFCDGTHGKIGFVGENQHEKIGRTKNYVGKNITIHDNRSICCHHGTCNLKDVFMSDKRPWINPDGNKDIDEIIKVIKTCPSGALSYTINNNNYNSWTNEEKVVIIKDGPLHVEGNIELKDDLDSEKKLITKNHYTLCRCGKSKNKPFCDGTHKDVDFKG